MTPLADPGSTIRRAGKPALAQALRASRQDTLATFALYAAALAEGDFAVPQRAELNPPLWELGHIDWFQQHWLARNPQRHLGVVADPLAPRLPPARQGADALYDSSRVPHDSRWSLPLPDAAATLADLSEGLERSLDLLDRCAEDDTGLYFHRLCLLHEDMHHEAALYMAQSLGLPVADARWQAQRQAAAPAQITLAAGPWQLGSMADDGFAFDNELAAHTTDLPDCSIDNAALRWAEFLPFVDAGGYADDHWWSTAGRAWRDARKAEAPRYLRRDGHAGQHWSWGRWQPLDTALPACHLSAFEAEAWCAWAGRRLPTEAEWERAAVTQPAAFGWGHVWEWTASDFAPFPGFEPHPYRDYSAPWFGSRRALRGGAFGTQPRMKHPRYRNFFEPGRNDIFAGLRSCAL